MRVSGGRAAFGGARLAALNCRFGGLEFGLKSSEDGS